MKKLLLFSFFIISFYSFGQTENKISKDEYKNNGFFNITKFGYIGVTELKQELFIEGEGNVFSDLDTGKAHAWSLQTINGYFLSPSFSLGIGVGLDGYHNPDFNTLPVVLDTRFYFSDATDSFYTFLNIGPSVRIGGENSKFRKGMVFNIGAGYKFKVANNLFLVSDIYYSHKTVSFTDEWIGTSDNIIKANGFGLSLGVIF